MAGIIRQYFQSSGEATQQAELPQKFQSMPQPASPLASHQCFARAGYADVRTTPVVSRKERLVGFRHLYSRGMTRMPVRRLGADGQPYPWDSGYQPNNMGPIRDATFNDALYQAGYGGFNLGLSFKVPTLNTTNSGQRSSSNTPANIDVARHPLVMRRSTGGGKA